jgi:hypothetical protein
VDVASEAFVDVAPEAEQRAGTDGAPPKKRTRRGTRGGRNRKKKVASGVDGPAPLGAADDAAGGAEPEAAREPVAVTADAAVEPSGEPGYVPMSEWIEDFDRRP